MPIRVWSIGHPPPSNVFTFRGPFGTGIFYRPPLHCAGSTYEFHPNEVRWAKVHFQDEAWKSWKGETQTNFKLGGALLMEFLKMGDQTKPGGGGAALFVLNKRAPNISSERRWVCFLSIRLKKS